ncbi:hypothetical protein [Duganella levis]|uniref:Uncharacterized protein n=1 Tax=Duganella levis TaxID=2692169 RepID=A0ABW9WAC9_9BURK|nr:hypothetical protein [Duganella levis]MYN30597.1 hypothetical protein [Duganella levis]
MMPLVVIESIGDESVGSRLENPCVGGSIPPRATKNIKNATFGWRFCFWSHKK